MNSKTALSISAVRHAGRHNTGDEVESFGGQTAGLAHALEIVRAMQPDLSVLAVGGEGGVDIGHAGDVRDDSPGVIRESNRRGGAIAHVHDDIGQEVWSVGTSPLRRPIDRNVTRGEFRSVRARLGPRRRAEIEVALVGDMGVRVKRDVGDAAAVAGEEGLAFEVLVHHPQRLVAAVLPFLEEVPLQLAPAL